MRAVENPVNQPPRATRELGNGSNRKFCAHFEARRSGPAALPAPDGTLP